jgi:hypothetical protein
MITKKQILMLAFPVSLGMLTACGGGDKAADKTQAGPTIDTTGTGEELNDNKEAVNELVDFKFHVFIANIPSPLETMIRMPDNGVYLDKSLVNPVANASKYKTLAKKALNYGIYGTDLGYLASFESPEVPEYFATTKSLAEELGAGDQFNQAIATSFQNNMGNRDSLIILMDQALGETEDYLKNDQRLELAILILAGSWLESQYLLLNSLHEMQNKDAAKPLFLKLNEQKNHLKSLIDLLKEQKGSAETKKLLVDFESLLPSFTTLNSDSEDAFLKALGEEVGKVRAKIIS